MLSITKELLLKDPLKPNRRKKLASVTKERKPVIRATGREDYSDYSERLRSVERTGQVHPSTSLTKAVVEDLKTYISRGLGLREVCSLVGVPWMTFQLWRTRYPLFDKFIEKCVAEVEMEALDEVREAGRGGVWQASAWALERRWPERYGKRDIVKQEIYHKHIEFVKIVLEVINDADPALKAEIVSRLRTRKINIGDQG